MQAKDNSWYKSSKIYGPISQLEELIELNKALGESYLSNHGKLGSDGKVICVTTSNTVTHWSMYFVKNVHTRHSEFEPGSLHMKCIFVFNILKERLTDQRVCKSGFEYMRVS